MTYRTPMRRDLAGRLEVLRVTCPKCERAGRYRVARLIERHGAGAGLPDWKDVVTADCPRRAKPGATWDICGAHFPDLNAALYGSAPLYAHGSQRDPQSS
jgi:hypothetical protein